MYHMKIIQKAVKTWINKNGSKWSAYADYCHLVEEIGELGEALTVKHGERQAGDGALGFADHSDIEEEIGDVIFSAIVLANKFDVDLDKCFEKTFKRYDKKVERRINR